MPQQSISGFRRLECLPGYQYTTYQLTGSLTHCPGLDGFSFELLEPAGYESDIAREFARPLKNGQCPSARLIDLGPDPNLALHRLQQFVRPYIMKVFNQVLIEGASRDGKVESPVVCRMGQLDDYRLGRVGPMDQPPLTDFQLSANRRKDPSRGMEFTHSASRC